MLVRPIRQARLWGRNPARAHALAASLAHRLGIVVRPEREPEVAVHGADVIVTTTPATEPILRAAWLGPGQHVTAMGSDAEHKNELEPTLIAKADRYVADSLMQTRRLGELRHAIAAGLIAENAAFAQLGEIVAGLLPARNDPAAITIADLTGVGVQDTAIANLARERASLAKAGTMFVS
jgi:ornithine cyclodeaminase